MLRITFDTDNAAFDDEGGGSLAGECARILREIADKIEDGVPQGIFQTIFDANGNDVGRFRLGEDMNRAPATRRGAGTR